MQHPPPPARKRMYTLQPVHPVVSSTVRPFAPSMPANHLHTAGDTSSAVIYYNGPASSRTSPTDFGTVSEPAKKWEGATRKTDLSAGRFTSSISDGADDLAKSQLAGSAKLGNEEFICFVDGSSTFKFTGGLLGLLGNTNCKADYWCASLDVGV